MRRRRDKLTETFEFEEIGHDLRFYPGFNTPGVPAATQPDPVRWAALEASFVDNGRAPWE
jgi:hypothetical protein